MKENLLWVKEALTDCLIASGRRFRFGSDISGSLLIALNDKYQLNDVSADELSDRIHRIGKGYLKKALEEARKQKMF